MSHQCYYCEQLFETKEKLYDHLEVHAETETKQKKKTKKSKDEKLEKKNFESGESQLTENEILEQFNESKSGEPSRMSSKIK